MCLEEGCWLWRKDRQGSDILSSTWNVAERQGRDLYSVVRQCILKNEIGEEEEEEKKRRH